ncbi:hypothetical protein [Corticicoccus populi]|uniref:Uncharacterized protein n=1 Tax=Corticicoccus populi TaxID=1812821 RepID=A0ABW5WTJ1_9STAP
MSIEALIIIGVILLIIIYLITDLIAWKKNKEITFYADIIAPFSVFTLSMIIPIMYPEPEYWAIAIPLIMARVFVPISLVFTIIKVIVIFIRKNKRSSSN